MGCVPRKSEAKEVKISTTRVKPGSPGQETVVPEQPGKLPHLPGRQVNLLSKASLIKQKVGGVSPDYQIKEAIGHSPYNQLKKCVYLPTGETRVVKIIHKSGLSEDAGTPGLQEFQVLRELDHPNVLKVYELFEDKFRFYLILEYCPWKDLLSFHVDESRNSVKYYQSIMHQLLSTIQYCHSKGIAVRNMELHKILVLLQGDQVTIKYTDFSASVINTVGNTKKSSPLQSSICIAPEVLAGNSGPECDLWSCGVVLHLLLFGRPPYLNSESADIKSKIQAGQVTLGDVTTIDPGAKELLFGLLVKDPKRRWTCQRALSCPWISTRSEASVSTSAQIESAIREMRQFRSAYMLKDAIFTFLSLQVISSADLLTLNEAFSGLDRNSDGKVSREELLLYYQQQSSESDPTHEISDLLTQIDSDNSGFIEYGEFLKASMNKSKYTSKQYLEMAFKAFDADGNGKVSAQDLKDVFQVGNQELVAKIEAAIAEADVNKDGEIDMKEFQAVALRVF